MNGIKPLPRCPGKYERYVISGLLLALILAGWFGRHIIQTSPIRLSGTDWLDVVKDNWSAPEGIYSRHPDNSMQRGKSFILSKDAWESYELQTVIQNPHDGGIIARWMDPDHWVILLFRQGSFFWIVNQGGQMTEHPVTPPYQIGDIIPAGGKNTAEFSHWYHAESTHRWIRGKDASIFLSLGRLDPDVEQYKLVMKGFTHGPQTVILSVNGTQLARLSNQGPPRSWEIPLPVRFLKPNGANEISFAIPGAKSPEGRDRRMLGLALQSLSIVEDRPSSGRTPKNPPPGSGPADAKRHPEFLPITLQVHKDTIQAVINGTAVHLFKYRISNTDQFYDSRIGYIGYYDFKSGQERQVFYPVSITGKTKSMWKTWLRTTNPRYGWMVFALFMTGALTLFFFVLKWASPDQARTAWAGVLIFGMVFVYAALWTMQIFPYRFFPSDDVQFLRLAQSDHSRTYIPVFGLWLKFCKLLWGQISDTDQSLLAFQALLANSMTLSILGWTVFRLTRHLLITALPILLFSVSSWQATYFFSASYSNLAAMLSSAVLFFFLLAYQTFRNRSVQVMNRPDASEGGVPGSILPAGMPSPAAPAVIIFLIMAGTMEGLFLLSSPSAPLMVLARILVLFALFHPIPWQRRFVFLLAYAGPIFYVGMSYFLIDFGSLLAHWGENLDARHFAAYFNKYGTELKPPSFSSIRVLVNSDLALTLLFLLLSLGTLIIWIHRFHRAKNIPVQMDHVILGMILFHEIGLEALHFTRLGRSHFMIYPFLLIFTALSIRQLGSIPKIRLKRYFLPLCYGLTAILLLLSVGWNVGKSYQLVESKQSLADWVLNQAPQVQFYLLGSDPHSGFLREYLSIPIKTVHQLSEIESEARGTKVGLILGPRGEQSGHSILYHCALDDFSLEKAGVQKPPGAAEIKKMYYAHYPSFLMEEENSQSLFFRGEIPKYDQDDSKVLIWIWQPRSS